MRLLSFQTLWILVSVVVTIAISFISYNQPERFIQLTDILAAIISILTGVSLAIFAILGSKPTLSDSYYTSSEEKRRIMRVISEDDERLSKQQMIIFLLFFSALCASVYNAYLRTDSTIDYSLMTVKISVSVFATINCASILISMSLPFLIKSLIHQRRRLEE